MTIEFKPIMMPFDKYPEKSDLDEAYQCWLKLEVMDPSYKDWSIKFIADFTKSFYRSNLNEIALPNEFFFKYAYHVTRLQNFCDWMEVGSYASTLLSRTSCRTFMHAIARNEANLSGVICDLDSRYNEFEV